jgi:ceramide glucosyltransferase
MGSIRGRNVVDLALGLGWLATGLAIAGSAYTMLAAWLLRRFLSKPLNVTSEYPAVSLLKPLQGGEPGLSANLESYCVQDYPAPVQIIFGVQGTDDPAIDVVRRLQSSHPECDIELIVDPRRHGCNPKI